MTLKELRNEKLLTQQQTADILNISLRSYKSYENDSEKRKTEKYKYLCEKLSKYNFIDEENGIVDIAYIKEKSAEVLKNYEINFCYLFGSYAKQSANSKSDIDLLVSSDVKGLKFYGLVEELRTVLHKKVDVLDINQLIDNRDLLFEILKYGVKIYG